MNEENDIVIDPDKQLEWNFEYVKMLLASVIHQYGGEVFIDNSALHKNYDIQLEPYVVEDRTGLKVTVKEVETEHDQGLG